MLSAKQPLWRVPGLRHVQGLVETFQSNIRTIAIRLARHENSEYVLNRHVDEAFKALAGLGLRRRRWYVRTEFEVGFGVSLLSLSLSCPDLVNTLIPASWPHRPSFAAGLLVALVLCGCAFVFHGWYRGKL